MQQIGIGAAAGSGLLLAAALLFQFVGGLAPCPMCIWQRWPHLVAVLAGFAAFLLPGRIWPLVGGGAMLVNAGLGAYHTGVERGWWPGPDSCSAPDLGALDAGALVDQLQNIGRKFPPNYLHDSWMDFLYWDAELEA